MKIEIKNDRSKFKKAEKPRKPSKQADPEGYRDLRNILLLKWSYPILAVIAFLVLIFVVFIILPFSEMEEGYYATYTGLQWWMLYSRGFVSALSTAGIALLTIVVTKIFEKMYDEIKERNKEIKENERNK
ncbi:MAG: hypothetical protein FWB74_00470 [Defluviitaleaceae bacterium]|nr:hypothetical protein [Defluviitaleaceae bacterium]